MGPMSDRTETFQTPGPAKLRIDVPKGQIQLIAEPATETRIELSARHGDGSALEWIREAEVAQIGDEIVVRNRSATRFGVFNIFGSIDAVIHAPPMSAASLAVGAGAIETTGKLGAVSAASGAGAIRIADCAEARARSGSGEVEIVSCSGSVSAKTGAGRVTIGKVGGDARVATGVGNTRLAEVKGAAHVTTGSGSVEVEDAGQDVEAFTASGNVDLRRVSKGRVRAKTVSGRISVGVAAGVAALLDVHTLSGRVHSELAASGPPAEGEPHVELTLSTVSGSVHVARAEATAGVAP
jgi:DUF4097 and DUF4098 domain-containing protein YvlB